MLGVVSLPRGLKAVCFRKRAAPAVRIRGQLSHLHQVFALCPSSSHTAYLASLLKVEGPSQPSVFIPLPLLQSLLALTTFSHTTILFIFIRSVLSSM